MEHAISLDIFMREEGYDFDASNSFAVSGKFGFTVKKNKAGGSPGAQGSIKFWLMEGFGHAIGDSDDLATVMKYAREPSIGLITEGTGKAKLSLTSAYTGVVEFERVGDCVDFLEMNPTVYADLRQRVLESLMTNTQIIQTVKVESDEPTAEDCT